MGRGLGRFQREVLQRIGREVATFGEARVGQIAERLGHARGLVSKVQDGMGTDHRIDVAHQIGLRRALAMLAWRGLILRYVDGSLELTEAGAAIAGDCPPWTPADISTDMTVATNAFQRRRDAAIAAGRLKPNGARWD